MNGQQKKIFLTALILLTGVAVGGVALWYIRSGRSLSPVRQSDRFSIKQAYDKENLVPFLVLGSGPASLAAALYGARTKVRTVVLKGNTPGGQLTGTSYIENWPAISKIRGAEVVKDFEEQASKFGAIMVHDSAKSVDLSQWPYVVKTEEGRTLRALALCLGTGATPRYLHIPGEKEYWGHGVTTCAICDAPYHKGDVVVVVGGGDSAVEEALELSSYAHEVRMLIRSDVMRASPTMIERLDQCSNVKLFFNRSLVEIKGVDGKVSGAVVLDNATQTQEEWPEIKGVFLAIGHTPNTALLGNQLATDQLGYIKMDGRTQATSVPGVFAAGDVSDPRYKQAGVAAGDGIKAGLDAVWWLSEIGYNGNVAHELEPFFFDPGLDNKVPVEQINTIEELSAVIKKAGDRLVIIDFFTPFCPSCMYMLPIVEWVGTKLKKEVLFVKVDASIAFSLVKKFKAPKVPHFIITKRGAVLGRSDDVMNKPELTALVKKYLQESK